MSEFSFNNDDNNTNIDIDIDIDIDNIIESLDNNSDINNFTKKLENELINYNNNSINETFDILKDKNIDFTNQNILLKLINQKDIFIYTLIFIIINLIFINKVNYKYIYLIIKIILFVVFSLIIKKNKLLH